MGDLVTLGGNSSGSLVELAKPANLAAPVTPTEEKLLAIWQEIFARQEISTADDFFVLGGYSLLVVQMVGLIRERIGCTLPLHQIFATPTIAELAAEIDRQREERGADWPADSALVAIKLGGARTPLFCVHDLRGKVFCYRAMSAYLDPDQPVIGIEGVGLRPGETPLTTIPELAARCIREMRVAQPNGPYMLAGTSLAGFIAYEMAQQLRAVGEKVAALVMFDSLLVYDPRKPRLVGFTETMAHYRWRKVQHQFTRLSRLPAKLTGATPKSLPVAPNLNYRDIVDTAQEEAGIPNLSEINRRALTRYEIKPYPDPILYFRAEEQRNVPEAIARDWWEYLTGGNLEWHRVPGDHVTLLDEPNVGTLGGLLRGYIGRVSGDH